MYVWSGRCHEDGGTHPTRGLFTSKVGWACTKRAFGFERHAMMQRTVTTVKTLSGSPAPTVGLGLSHPLMGHEMVTITRDTKRSPGQDVTHWLGARSTLYLVGREKEYHRDHDGIEGGVRTKRVSDMDST